MTLEELREIIYARIEKAYANRYTRKTYKGAFSRIAARIPMHLFGNESLIRTYRQLLSSSSQSLFGVVWRKVYEELEQRGMPCVHPDRLIYQIRRPSVIAHPIEALSIVSSYSILAISQWKDVMMIDGRVSLRRTALEKKEVHCLRLLADYFWPGQDPEPDAPLIALNPACPMVPLPEEMVEDAVFDLNEGEEARGISGYMYRLYRAMCATGWSLQEIEPYLAEIEGYNELMRSTKEDAMLTLNEALRAVQMGQRGEVKRLWDLAMVGGRGFVSMVAVQPPRAAPVIRPAANPQWALNVGSLAQTG